MTDPMTLPHRIEAAEGADRALDAEIARLVGTPHGRKEIVHYESRSVTYIDECALRYTASIDAALTLVPPGASWSLARSFTGSCLARVVDIDLGSASKFDAQATAATPALALCAAALRAKESTHD